MTARPGNAKKIGPASTAEADRFEQCCVQHRDRLQRMVRLRLDPRLQGRLDPSDVLQEALVEGVRRLDEYRRNPSMPMFLWLRFLTGQKLLELHRRHLGVRARNAGREITGAWRFIPDASSVTLAAWLVGRHSSPSQAAARAETCGQLQAALEQMELIDREVLVLRHFEQLTNAEVAQVLGIEGPAASKRYVRALERLRSILQPFQECREPLPSPPRHYPR